MSPIDADYLKSQIKDLAFQCGKMIWSGGELHEEFFRVVNKMIDDAPTITPPPNDPLTLEQLREIDFVKDPPVYVVSFDCYWPGTCCKEGYSTVEFRIDSRIEIWTIGCDIPIAVDANDYGKTWLAYRRKPEEETT